MADATPATPARTNALATIRSIQFLYLVPALGALALGPLLLLLARWRGRPRKPRRALWRAYAFLGITIAGWALALYFPGSTVLHQGTYLVPLVAFLVGALSFWSLSPLLARAVVAVQAVWTVLLYAAFTPTRVGSGTQFPGEASVPLYLLAALSALVTVYLLARLGRTERAGRRPGHGSSEAAEPATVRA